MATAKKKTAPKKKTAAPAKTKTAAPAKTKSAAPAKTKTVAAKKKASPPAKTMAGPRADFGASLDTFFAKPNLPLRDVLLKVRTIVEEAAPDAVASLKWGQPFYTLEGQMFCAIGGHKEHVNLIFSGPPGTFADPGGLLTGAGQTGRHLKLTSVSDIPVAAVKGWLKSAATLARSKAKASK